MSLKQLGVLQLTLNSFQNWLSPTDYSIQNCTKIYQSKTLMLINKIKKDQIAG